ncbi:hypothetical protein BKA80DRAFT_302692 [Phyllosticta citrichinensis]
MAPIGGTLRARVADHELDSQTKQYSSGDRLRYPSSIDSTHQTKGVDGSATPHPHSMRASPVPYTYIQKGDIAPRPWCNPASPLPISIYNFIDPQTGDTGKSLSSTKAVGDMSGLPVAAAAAVQDISTPSTPHASLASRRDGQPLPKPSQPPPKPAPGPKPQSRGQDEDLLCWANSSFAPADDVRTNELQQQEQTKQEPPAPVQRDACDSEWDRASSSESDSDSKSRCSMVCSCYSCYSDYSSPEGSMSDFFETATLASQGEEGEAEGEVSQIAANGQPHCSSGDGQANDVVDDAGSSLSTFSEGWVDLAEPLQHHHRLHYQRENEQDLWSPSRGPKSHSRSSPPPPPPPPPPSSPRRR